MTAENKYAALLADLTSGDEERAEAAARSLAPLGKPVVRALEPLLRSKDADHRWWAVRTLGQMTEPPVERLVAALSDASSDVRAAAALGLAAHTKGAEAAAPKLVKTLDDEDNIVSIMAVNALVAMGKAATPALLEGYELLSLRGRIQAMRAISELHDHSAIPLMMKAIEQDSAMLRYWAEHGLNGLGLDMVYIKPG